MANGGAPADRAHRTALALPEWLVNSYRVLRIEERILLVTWIVAAALVLSSPSGELTLVSVFKGYFYFFAVYLIVLFLGSRFLFWIGEAWKPRPSWLRHVKLWLWGPDSLEGMRLTRLDRVIIPNAEALAKAPERPLLGNDLELVRGVFLLFANLTIYSNIKVRIPFINQTIGDASFKSLDELLFGTRLIPAIEDWFAHNKGVIEYFSDVYMHDYMWMIVLVFILYLRRDQFAMRWTIGAVCLVYIVGILLTVVYPSVGPCFIERERFEWLRGTRVGNAQEALLHFYARAARFVESGGSFEASPFQGIAAFPSLHVAHMVIMLVVAIRRVPIYAVWMAWVTIMTSIATVGFGWHYGVDAIGGILLAIGLTEGLYRLMKRDLRLRATT